MKANPGGQIALKAVVGRDSLISFLWETVAQQSIVITAERRIGKTTVMQKMHHEAAPGWTPVFQDLERCHTAAEFAVAVYKEIHQFLDTKGKVARRAKELFAFMGGIEVAGLFKLPEKAAAQWKDMLTQSIEDLVQENDATSSRLLFLWDEMPFMLANIRDREGEKTAMEVLDLLRYLRQTHPSLRMIITGSIGLHHVLTSLRDKNYASSPVNDMFPVEVLPLAEHDAVRLATQLIKGESLASANLPAGALAIAREADCFPYYIHHVVKALKSLALTADPDLVARAVAGQLVNANDPWKLLHYRDRLKTYYGADQGTATLLLDDLAAQRDTASVTELLAMLKSMSTFDDRDHLLRLLDLMERDHYFQRDLDGRYRFRFPLIRRWWKLHRGL